MEMLRRDQNNRSSGKCVTRIRPGIVPVDARRDVVPCRASDVERIIGATKHIDVYTHRSRSFEARKSSHLRMTGTVFVSTHNSCWDLHCSGQKPLHFFPFPPITPPYPPSNRSPPPAP